jgi:hypothetical protein
MSNISLLDSSDPTDALKLQMPKKNHHGKRADAIVKGMLEHSRAGSGEKVPTDINALADKYLRLSYHGMRAKDKSFKADFSAEFDPDLPKINVVPQDIGRVLLNIINNAFQAVGTGHAQSLQPIVTVSPPPLRACPEISGGAVPVPINREGCKSPSPTMAPASPNPSRTKSSSLSLLPNRQGRKRGWGYHYPMIL